MSCKYRQVWSYFEDLIARNSIVQSKFNFDSQFRVYNFFLVLQFIYMHDDIINSVFTLHANMQPLPIPFAQLRKYCVKIARLINSSNKTRHASGDGVIFYRLE